MKDEGKPKKLMVSIVWRPNNYRRQIRVKPVSVSLRHSLSKTLINSGLDCNWNGRVLSVKGFMGHTLQLGKKTLTAIWSQNKIGGHKETYWIEARTTGELDARIKEISLGIQKKIDSALYGFCSRYSVTLDGSEPVWSRHEDWMKGEEVIDSIPRETIIHDTVFKKVYPEGVEFIGGKGIEPGSRMKNYLKNRAVEDIAPELAYAVTSLVDSIVPMMDENKAVLGALMEQVRAHLSLIKAFRDENVRYRKHFRWTIRKHDRDLREFF